MPEAVPEAVPEVAVPDPGAPAVLVVQNDPGSGPGRFAGWFADEGVRLVVVAGDEVPESPRGHDGVLLLGGGLMPDEDDRAPWLPRERMLAAACVDGGVPLLGICLGGQLLAHVLGGTVVASSERPEHGSVQIDRLPASDDDPLLGALPSTFPAVEHHRDEVTVLPPGAVHLATSATCPVQAFRVGECAWGLQFHPEASADRLARWDPDRLAAEGFDLAALRVAAETAEPASEAAARALVRAFAAVVRSRIRAR